MEPARHERRRYKRLPLACPVSLNDAGGEPVGQSRGLNISDGGMLLPLPPERAPEAGSQVRATFSVPRSTPNTFLLEEFSCKAFVVRQEPENERSCQVALRFEPPLDLGLEV